MVGHQAHSRPAWLLRTLAQLEFVLWAFTLGKRFEKQKMMAREAVLAMKRIGSREFAQQWPGDSYARDRGAPMFARLEILDESVFKYYFGKKEGYLMRLVEKARTLSSTIAAEVGCAHARS